MIHHYNSIPCKKSQACFLRKITNSLTFGFKLDDVGIRPSITKENLPNRFPCLPRLTNADYQRHFDNKATYYFQGQWRYDEPTTLVLIDIDNHKFGNLDDGKRFAEHLRKTFTNLTYETSTNGNGVHGYLLMKKHQVGAEAVNETIDHLDKWLKQELRKFDPSGLLIENVEAKGKAPILKWQGKRLVEVTKAGGMAKLPRTDIRNTAIMSWQDIRRLPIEEVKTIKIRKTKGSCSDNIFPQEFDFKKQFAAYRTYSYHCMNMLDRGKKKVTYMDFSIAFVILSELTKHKNDDDSMPTARIKKIWQTLFAQGLVSRGWDNSRWKMIRDTMAKLGYIDKVDERYWFFEDGRKGQAMKWHLIEEMEFEQLRTHTHIFMRSVLPKYAETWHPIRVNGDDLYFIEAERRLNDVIKPYETQLAA